jgi:hypothetical protein
MSHHLADARCPVRSDLQLTKLEGEQCGGGLVMYRN